MKREDKMMTYGGAAAYQNTNKLGGNPRQTESRALSECARKLTDALNSGDYEAMIQATRTNLKLWNIFASELSKPTSPVPEEIKTNILNLAAFIDKQTMRFIYERDPDLLNVIININRNIAAGLASDPEDDNSNLNNS